MPPTYRVVLADDVAAIRRLIRMTIEGGGRFRVVGEATNGREAVEAAGQHQPDLILLDLSMPELDGMEALPQVLATSPGTKVVVLSGFNHSRMAPIARRLGASAYLEKGIEPQELVRELLQVLEPGAAPEPAREPRHARAPPVVRPDRPVDVLLIEDNPQDATRIERMLAASDRPAFRVRSCMTLADGLASLERSQPDVVIADVFLPDSSGLETVMDVLARAGPVPVVVLTGFPNTDLANQAIKMGAEDFLAKEGLEAPVLQRSLLYARERRQAYEARGLMRRQAEEVTRLRQLEHLKSEFMNAAAHELRTPLTPIRLQLEVLRRSIPEDAAPQRRSLDLLERNFARLGKLVQDLLEVARLQAGRMELSARVVDLAPMLREAVESFDAMAGARGTALVADVPPSLEVRGDAARLSQVVYNLLSNALKFTSRGEVRVEAGRRGDEVRIAVRDTGLGLTEAQRARLFQPFTQVHDRQGVVEGTGLGLFVSRGIIELHGGRLACESAGHGQGSTFTIVLPAPEPVRPPAAAASAPAPDGLEAAA